jgi:hypothetical protein
MHTRPWGASGARPPCALDLERAGNSEQTSGELRRENAEVCLLFEIDFVGWAKARLRAVPTIDARSSSKLVGTLPPSLFELRRQLCPPYALAMTESSCSVGLNENFPGSTTTKAPPGGGTGRGSYVRLAAAADRTIRESGTEPYSTTWTIRRERGSTSTVRPFTTV